MDSRILGSLLTGALIPGFGITKNNDASVTISIPKDHPKAEKLLALAKELATRKTTASGIEYNTGPNQGNVDKVMTLLRDIIDVEMVEAALARQHLDQAGNAAAGKLMSALDNPNALLSGLLGNPLMNIIGIKPESQQRMDNILKAERKKA